MPISDVYTADSGLVTISTATQSPILELRTQATKRAFIVGVRMKIGVTSAAAGNTVTFTLARTTVIGTGGTAIQLRANDAASAAAISTAASATGGYTIVPTLGNILGEWMLPQTTGSMWEEFPPLGYEWVAGVSTSIVGFVTNSAATGTPVEWQFVVSE